MVVIIYTSSVNIAQDLLHGLLIEFEIQSQVMESLAVGFQSLFIDEQFTIDGFLKGKEIIARNRIHFALKKQQQNQ